MSWRMQILVFSGFVAMGAGIFLHHILYQAGMGDAISILGLLAPGAFPLACFAWYMASDRRTFHHLPDCMQRIQEKHTAIAPMVRAILEKDSGAPGPWQDEIHLSLHTKASGTSVHATFPGLGKTWVIPPQEARAIHTALFEGTDTFTPYQRRLWLRWIQENATWEDKGARYTAHERVRAHRRLLDVPPLRLLLALEPLHPGTVV